MHPTTPPEPTICRDYLRVTVRETPDIFAQALAGLLKGEMRTCGTPRGYGYRHAIGWFEGDQRTAMMLYSDGRNPMLDVPGPYSQDVYTALAPIYSGVASLARGDAALDIDDDCAFELAVKFAVDYATKRRMGTECKGDWLVPGSPKGRTLYVGSRESELYIRIYEYKKHHGHGPHCRIEVEFKPQKGHRKLEAFALTPAEIFSQSRAALHIAKGVWVEDIAALQITPRVNERHDLKRRIDHLVSQWMPTLNELITSLPGGAADLGDYLVDHAADLSTHRAEVKMNRAAAVTLATDSLTISLRSRIVT